MNRPLRILIVEESEEDAALLVTELENGGYAVTCERVVSWAEVESALDRDEWDLIIADYEMPHFHGLAVLDRLRERELDLPFILVSETVDEDLAVAALTAGAHEYVMKSHLTRLIPAVEQALRETKVRNERRKAEEEDRSRERKQAAVAELGLTALAGADLTVLLDDTVTCVAATLNVDYCMVSELTPDGDRLKARAGTGWKRGVLGKATVPAGNGSQAGYTLLCREPVVADDLGKETRFAIPAVLKEHGISSGASVIIHGVDRPFGVLSAFTGSRRTFTRDDVHFLQSVANVLATAIERKRMEEERTRHATELASRCIAAQEDERKRIARELHDETAQALSSLLINLDLLEGHVPPDGHELRSGIARIRSLTRRTLDATRALSHDLRPTILDDVGLVAAIHWFAAEHRDMYGADVDVDIEQPPVSLSQDLELAIFRIAQEALTNSGKYAGAKNVCISLSFPESIARIVIEDDGKGFDPRRVHGPTRHGRLGLYGMRERAALLGGSLTVTASPGCGTRVTAEIPLSRPPSDELFRDTALAAGASHPS